MEKKENRNSYSELPKGEDPSPAKTLKKEPKKGKENRELRILRKSKNNKEKNDPSRFSGEGINFHAKIIGIEDVFDARGNRMCQEALQKLKAAVKTSGDHKQKIILNISLNGIIIKDEKSEEVLHHHPIHKISCISQDTKDNRAFGFVYGCPKTGHRFFAIKTEKAASQVVMTLRDLFLVALEIKKKEIESAEKESDEPDTETVKDTAPKMKTTNGFSNGVETVNFPTDFEKQEIQRFKNDLLYSNTVLLPEETAPVKSESYVAAAAEIAIDTLLDLQSEVSILQQGISQMDQSIAHTVSQKLGISFSEDEISEASTSSIPTSFQFKMDKISSLYHETMSISSRSSSTSDYNVNAPETKLEDNDTPKKDTFRNSTSAISEAASSSSLGIGTSDAADGDSTVAASVEDKYAVFLDIDSIPSIFDNPSLIKISTESVDVMPLKITENSVHEMEKVEKISTSPSVAFAELDPLGNQPFIDKKNFFQDVKTPPKKVLKDLVGTNVFGNSDSELFTNTYECLSTFSNLRLNQLENSTAEGIISSEPPKLPPKRNVASPHFTLSSEMFQESGLSSDGAWEPKNPFNPFLTESYSDLPPPTSPPPPPPPPRLPIKTPESSPSLSPPPPPRPPAYVNGIPTPPLPKRKVPLSSTNRTWFSFDQEAVMSYPAVSFTSSSSNEIAPPLPSPARKLPPVSPLLKSSSASNSPATMRRLYNRSPYLDSNLAPVIKENSDDYCLYLENNVSQENKESDINILTSSPHKVLSRHSSIAQDSNAYSGLTFNPFRDSQHESRKDSFSPPLPPKPISLSQPKSSPIKKMGSALCVSSSSNASATESSNGAHSSSSLVFSSLDDNKVGSSSEALFTNSTSSQSDVFTQSSPETVQLQSSSSTNEEKVISPDDKSPDSIFRRKGDPFADDFFLSLHKKSSDDSQSDTTKSCIRIDPFDNKKTSTS